ncbi:MAG: ferrous iron transport protein B [Clostridia bacterium]|nr:ferrous iron transport protein B [Clostridia bacterium]
MKYRMALVGNPNCGKTTLFNELTGSNQYVGNWPGVTVEQKSGHLKHHKNDIDIIDLPGIYSLSTYSLEEVITRDYIEKENPDVIINIVDASNIERNLFLTLQLMEMRKPMVIALNMMDVLQSRGDKLDVKALEKRIGVPILPIVARKSEGVHLLVHKAIDQIGKVSPIPQIYPPAVQSLIDELERKMKVSQLHIAQFIDEGVADVSEQKLKELNELVEKRIQNIDMDRDMIISDEKYNYITKIVGECMKKSSGERETVSDKIDKVVTNRVLAIPIFMLMMLFVFWVAFGPVGSFISDGFSVLVNDYIIGTIQNLLINAGVADWLYSLIVNGILGGVGSVLSFLPQIAVLFLMLSFLEDSGYMARAAFIMDRLLRRFGLSGRSFIPMLMGFGCTVPALMAARTLENERDRRLTMMITPFMSCSARLPVYAVFAGVFFKGKEMLVIFSLYILGILIAVLSGIILKKFVAGNDVSNFIMELPEYRKPTVKNLGLHTWEKTRGFITKAGTVLLLAFVVIWFLQQFDFKLNMVADSSYSMFGSIGKWIAPVFAPLGFGDWHASSSLLTGIVAKEAVVGTLGILYGVGDAVAADPAIIAQQLSTVFTPLSAYSFMTFTLLYTPCIAALATLRREMNSLKWTAFTIAYQLVVAWTVSFLIFQIGSLFF